jgi:hypothetical protein
MEEGRAYLQHGWKKKGGDFGQMQREEVGEKPWQTSSSSSSSSFFFFCFKGLSENNYFNGANSNLTLKRPLKP